MPPFANLVLRWKKQAEDDVVKELTQRSQFHSERIDLSEALVREAFQNILDAGDETDGNPIRVRIRIVRNDQDTEVFLESLLEGLKPHLQAAGIPYESEKLIRPDFLVIEDFGTTGLTGPWGQLGAGGWNDFFRSFGASNKSGRTGGRWGLGKLVFTSASAIRTFFALTVRSEDTSRQPLLMGQTVLKTHEIPGQGTYGSHGFFCAPGAEGTIQLPVTEPDTIRRLAAALGFTRSREPGLSLAVINPLGTFDERQIISFILSNYYLSILRGRLEVEVGDEIVSKATFDNLVQHLGDHKMRTGRLAGFIREIEQRGQKGPDAVASQKWALPDQAAFSENDLQALRAAYGDRRLVYVRFPINLRSRSNEERPTHVDVALRQTGPDEEAATLCVRGLLTLPGEADRIKALGCFAALLAEDEAIVSFLGDAEGPAHTDWNPREERVVERWLNAPARLAEVRKAVRVLIGALSPALSRRDDKALIDIFSVARMAPPARSSGERKVASRPAPPLAALPPSQPKYRIAKRSGGFSVSAGPGMTADDTGLKIRVRMAFDVPRGDPFKQHHKHDFDLNVRQNIRITSNDADVDVKDEKTVLLTVRSSTFKVSFEGFDPRRDLVVDAWRSSAK
jgi:hypothetical protein